MKAVIQRVSQADVKIKDDTAGSIQNGLLVLLAIHKDDTEEKIDKAVNKILNLRIFHDKEGKMNLSLNDVQGELLVVSQFTLYGDTKKGKRPGFSDSAGPEKARLFYDKFVSICRQRGITTETGEFGAEMKVSLTNDGPVTLIVDI